jgi:hypothetical protein
MKKTLIIVLVMMVAGFFPIVVNADTESEAKAEAHVNYAPVFEGNSKRGSWPGSAHSVHPTMPGNFAGVPQTHEPLEIERFIRTFKYEWSRSEIDNFLQEGDLKNVEVESRAIASFPASNNLKIIFPQVRPRASLVNEVGIVKARSTKAETSSEAVLGRVMAEALDMGGNVIVPLNEGAGRVLGASGWAISLGYTHVVIGGQEGQAGVGGVGLGYASGKSSHKHEPFARFAVLNVAHDLYGKLLIFPEQLKRVVAKAPPTPTEKPRKNDPMVLEQNKMLQKKLEIEEEKSRYYKYRYKNKK